MVYALRTHGIMYKMSLENMKKLFKMLTRKAGKNVQSKRGVVL